MNELFEQMKEFWEDFEKNHTEFEEKGKKAAGARARKAIGNLKKLVVEYRAKSVEAAKK